MTVFSCASCKPACRPESNIKLTASPLSYRIYDWHIAFVAPQGMLHERWRQTARAFTRKVETSENVDVYEACSELTKVYRSYIQKVKALLALSD
jgi:hypothetical protein